MAGTGFGAVAPTPLVRTWRTAFLTLRDETLTTPTHTSSTAQMLDNLIFSHSHALVSAAPELPSDEVLSDILFMMELVAAAASDEEDCSHIYTHTSRLIHDICRRVSFSMSFSSFSSVLNCFRKMLDLFLGKNATGDKLTEISSTATIIPAIECLQAISIFESLWKSRNSLVFESKNIPTWKVLQSGVTQAENFNEAMDSRGPLITSHTNQQRPQWSPPPCGKFKLNTDVAYIDGQSWGIGVLVRDHEGYVLGAACWQAPCGPEVRVAEALGMCYGLQFALDMGFLELIAESDCIQLTNAISRKMGGSSAFDLLVANCLSFAQEFLSISFCHVIRANNFSAHNLAKFALQNPNSLWVEETPDCIAVQVGLDLGQPTFI